MCQVDDDEQRARRCGKIPGGRYFHPRGHVEFAPATALQVRGDHVPSAEQDGGVEFGVEAPSDRHLAYGVEQHPEHVVEDRGDGAAVRDPRSAHVPVVEDVLGDDPLSATARVQVVPVRIIGSAPQAPTVMRWKLVAVSDSRMVLVKSPPPLSQHPLVGALRYAQTISRVSLFTALTVIATPATHTAPFEGACTSQLEESLHTYFDQLYMQIHSRIVCKRVFADRHYRTSVAI